MPQARRRHNLHGLTIDEISLVDAPGNQHAKVALMKSLVGAIPGAVEIRKGLPEAAQGAFDRGFASAGQIIAALVETDDEAIDAEVKSAAEAFGAALAELYGGEEAPADGVAVGKSREFGAALTEIAKSHNITVGAKPARRQAMPKYSAEIVKALAGQYTATGAIVEKSAAAPADVQAEVMDMVMTLAEAVTGIMDDDGEVNKAAAIQDSIADFTEAAEARLAEAGITKNDKQQQEPADPPRRRQRQASGGDDANGEVVKALRTQIEALQAKVGEFQNREAERESIAKARKMLGGSGPVEQLAKALRESTPDVVKVLESTIGAMVARNREGGDAEIFKALGVKAPEGDGVESPVVKAAQQRADRFGGAKQKGA